VYSSKRASQTATTAATSNPAENTVHRLSTVSRICPPWPAVITRAARLSTGPK
jgi:hypothetical protein